MGALSSRYRELCCGLVAAACLSLLILVSPFYEPRGDASIYISTALNLLDGNGYTHMGAPFIARPPGFSFLLVPVLAVAGKNYMAMNLFVSLFGVAAVAFLYLYMRERLGDGLALILAITLWVSPALRVLSNQVLSDLPGLALLLGILLLERWARTSPTAGRDWILAICLGLACYVRSGLQILVPAILLARAFEWQRLPPEGRGKGSFSAPRALILGLLPFAVMMPWNLWISAQDIPVPVEEFKLHSYSTAMWHRDFGDPSSQELSWDELASRVRRRAVQTVSNLATRMQGMNPGRTDGVLACFGLISWLIILWRRRGVPEIYAGALFCVLLVYFGYAQRLSLPIFVVVLSNAAEVGVLAASHVLSRSQARALVGCLLLMLAIYDYELDLNWESQAREHAMRVDLAEHLNAEFREGAMLAADDGRHHQLYSGRPVKTLGFAFERDGIDRVNEIIAENHVEGLILHRGRPLSRHFLARYPRVYSKGFFDVVRLRAPVADD